MSVFFLTPSYAMRSLHNHTGSWLPAQAPHSCSLGTVNPQIRLVEKIPVPLSSSPFLRGKATPKLPQATADSRCPCLPLDPLLVSGHLVSDQNVPQTFKVGLSPVFHLQNIPWNCLPFSNALQNKCFKKLSQSSLTQSYSVSLKYGFSKSLDFLPSAPFSLIPPPHPKTQQHTRPEGDTELSLAFPNLNIPTTQSSAHPQLSHIYNIRDQGRGRLLLIHTTLGCSFCWCWGRGVCVCLCAV